MSDRHVLRIWSGVTPLDLADEYEDYLLQTGMAEYTATPGNVDAYFTRRDEGDRTTFLAVTVWESMDAVRAFAGENPEVAVFYPEDDRFLVERDLMVKHYEVFAARGD